MVGDINKLISDLSLALAHTQQSGEVSYICVWNFQKRAFRAGHSKLMAVFFCEVEFRH
jgi:hypothetical protein